MPKLDQNILPMLIPLYLHLNSAINNKIVTCSVIDNYIQERSEESDGPIERDKTGDENEASEGTTEALERRGGHLLTDYDSNDEGSDKVDK